MNDVKEDNDKKNEIFNNKVSFVTVLALIFTMVKDIIEAILKLINDVGEISAQAQQRINIIYGFLIILACIIFVCFKKFDDFIQSNNMGKVIGYMSVVSVVYIVIQNALLEYLDFQGFIFFIAIVISFVMGFVYLLFAGK